MASPEPNLMFGQYRLLRELNRGATAIVYEALDTSRNKRVAAKVRLLERVLFAQQPPGGACRTRTACK